MWSRSRAKVTAPAPAKYPGSGRLRLRNPDRLSVQSVGLMLVAFTLVMINKQRSQKTKFKLKMWQITQEARAEKEKYL